MLRDELDDPPGQPVLAGQIDTILDMRHDDLGAGVGVELGVWIVHAFTTVFNERSGPDRFADIMMVRADAASAACPRRWPRRRFGHVADDQGVMIGAGCLQQELAQERVCGPGDFQQLERRRQAEHARRSGIDPTTLP